MFNSIHLGHIICMNITEYISQSIFFFFFYQKRHPLVTNCNGCENFHTYKVMDIQLATDRAQKWMQQVDSLKWNLVCVKGSSLLAVLPAHSYSAFLNCAILLCMSVLIQNNLEEELIRKTQFPWAIILFLLFDKDKEHPQH